MNRYILKILTSVFLLGSIVSGCIREDIGNIGATDEGVNLVISVSGMGSRSLSRANSERTDRSRIEDMNIVLVGANDVIKEIIYIPSGQAAKPSTEENDNALVNGSLPADDGELTYHVGKTSMEGVSRIFVVCNYWQVDDNGNILEANKNLNNCNIKTINELKALKQGTPFIAGIQTSTLFGEAKLATGTDSHGGQIYNCELKRTTAMVTVAIKSGSDIKPLNTGVKITPRSIQLHNVPTECFIGNVNSINSNGIKGTPDGIQQLINWEPLTSENNGQILGGHGKEENITPLFMFENIQGENGNINGKETDKTPENGKEGFCSYLEVTADYLFSPQIENQKFISGKIKYRLYLGKNITNDFNVERNKHYQVTLSLTGMGGLVEDGKTDSNGFWIAEGNDLSWRVDSGDITSGGSFLTDGVNMASNGFLDYIGFVKEPDHHYRIYAETNVPWLWSETVDGGGRLVSLTAGTDVIVYEAEQCGGEPGVSYIKLFAQPWLDEYPYYWQDYGGSTISSWIESGVRKANMILWDVEAGKEASRFELRQWLPMPVMVDNNGNPITDNPNNAEFFYSRIDVYEGREIPWGSDYYNNNWNASGLATNMWNFFRLPSYESRSYNSNYGFDQIIALYSNKPDAFTFQKDYGCPSNALGCAIFRAGNAVTSNGGSLSYNFEEMARIGLPTVTEWEKIMKYGVVDNRFGISNVPYWTSTMEGTQTYVYNPISGVKSLEKRNEKHRTRLVYHKYNYSQKKW